MERTFENPKPVAQTYEELEQFDAKRREENAVKDVKGEHEDGGSARRATVASKDPKDFETHGGPGSHSHLPVQDPVL